MVIIHVDTTCFAPSRLPSRQFPVQPCRGCYDDTDTADSGGIHRRFSLFVGGEKGFLTPEKKQRETSVFYTTSGFDLELFNA